jgi:hypothetical protein
MCLGWLTVTPSIATLSCIGSTWNSCLSAVRKLHCLYELH